MIVTGKKIDDIVRERLEALERWPEQPFTPDILRHAKPDEDVLVLWNGRAGVPPGNRLIVEPVIGGAMGVSRLIENRIVVFAKSSPLLTGYELRGNVAELFMPQRRWAAAWSRCEIDGVFSWRKRKNRRVTTERLRPVFRGRVFELK